MINIYEFRSSPWATYYNIIDQIGLFLEAALFVYLMVSLLPTRKKWMQTKTFQLLSAFVIAVLYSATSVLSDYEYMVWFMTILGSGLLYAVIFFSERIYKKLLLSCIYCCTVVTLDGMVLFTIIELSDHQQMSVAGFTCLFLIRRLLFKLPLAACVRFYIKNDTDAVIKMPTPYLICVIGIALVESFWILLIPSHFIGSSENIYRIMNCAGSLSILLSMYYLFGATAKNYKENLVYRLRSKEYEVLKQSSLQNDQFLSEVSQMRHDMQAHLFCIHSLLEEKEYKEAKDYIQTMLRQPPQVETTVFCSNKTINTILQMSKREAGAENIPFEAQVNLTEKLYIANKDLCALLSNLCSNALAASRKTKSPRVEIKIETVKAYLSIIVTNNTDYDVCKANPLLDTTKPDAANHGIGLVSIESVIQKYNGIHKIESGRDYFKFNILLENYGEEQV